MKKELALKAIKAIALDQQINLADRNKPINGEKLSGVKVKRVNGRAMSYADRHRGNWFKPEYDLTEIQIAQDTDSFLYKAIQKKSRALCFSWLGASGE